MSEPKDLAGVKKKSFSMFFGGGEIWFEHLDGIYEYTDIAIEKLENDYQTFKKPSKPSLIAIVLDETDARDELISEIANKLLNSDKVFMKVVFIGVNKATKRKIKDMLKEASFLLNFINDLEKAKEWLVSK